MDDYIIRQVVEEDAAALRKYTGEIFDEAPYLLTTSEEFTLSDEEQRLWIADTLSAPTNYAIVAIQNNEIVGFLIFRSGTRLRQKHLGSFGITVKNTVRGKGIGSKLLVSLFEWAKEHPTIEKVSLEVFAENVRARELYAKLGFEEEGYLKRAVRYKDGTYDDIVVMARMFQK